MKLQRTFPISTLAVSLLCEHESFGASFTALGFEDADGVSDDGVFVGGSRWSADEQAEAVRWTKGGGALGLGFLSGASDSSAYAMSPDGQILVGSSGDRAFRWSAASGMSDLGTLPGKTYHGAFGVSGDVSGVGLNLTGWTLSGALAVSADGAVVVGWGTNPQGEDEAWMAVLGATPPPLTIRLFSTSVAVGWPAAFSNFMLQSRISFAPSDNWSPVTNLPVLSAGELLVTNSAVGGTTFFRLKLQ